MSHTSFTLYLSTLSPIFFPLTTFLFHIFLTRLLFSHKLHLLYFYFTLFCHFSASYTPLPFLLRLVHYLSTLSYIFFSLIVLYSTLFSFIPSTPFHSCLFFLSLIPHLLALIFFTSFPFFPSLPYVFFIYSISLLSNPFFYPIAFPFPLLPPLLIISSHSLLQCEVFIFPSLPLHCQLHSFSFFLHYIIPFNTSCFLSFSSVLFSPFPFSYLLHLGHSVSLIHTMATSLPHSGDFFVY